MTDQPASTLTVAINADTSQVQKNLDNLHDSMANVIGFTGPKPGWQTSEFWLKLLALLLTYLYASGTIPTTGVVAQAVAIGATMLGALGYTVVRGQLKKAHALGGLGLPLLDASNDNAAVAPAVKQAGFVRLGVMLAIAAIGGALLFGCSTATRQRELGYTLTGVITASAALDTYVPAHELALAKCDPATVAKADCEARVAKFQDQLAKARAEIRGALNLIGTAYKANNDPAVATAEAAAAAAYAFLQTLGVSL